MDKTLVRASTLRSLRVLAQPSRRRFPPGGPFRALSLDVFLWTEDARCEDVATSLSRHLVLCPKTRDCSVPLTFSTFFIRATSLLRYKEIVDNGPTCHCTQRLTIASGKLGRTLFYLSKMGIARYTLPTNGGMHRGIECSSRANLDLDSIRLICSRDSVFASRCSGNGLVNRFEDGSISEVKQDETYYNFIIRTTVL